MTKSGSATIIAALQVAIIVVLFMLISPFALLHDQFNTWSEFETSRSKTLKVGKCTKTVRSGCIHNSNLSEKRHKALMQNSRLIQVRIFYQNDPKLKC